jgi:hypothetical protein
VRLVGLCLAASALVALVGAGASAATASSTVALKVKVTGSGTLRVKGSKAFTCRAASCLHTFHVTRGKRIMVKASPLAGWKLTTWAGACKGSAATCSLKLKARKSVAVTFVPPGDRLNPYPLGTSVLLYGDWRVKVNSAILNADTQVEAVTDPDGYPVNPPPPTGAQYSLVNLSETYVGGGSTFAPRGYTEGQGNALYSPSDCTPPSPDLGSFVNVYSGVTVTGNVCYEIASNDASTLLLRGSVPKGDTDQTVWFALQ